MTEPTDLPPELAPTPAARWRPLDSVFTRLRAYLFTGIVVAAPIFLTIYLTWNFLKWVDSLVTPWIPDRYNPESYLHVTVPGIGLVLVLTFFVLVGWVTRNFLGRFLFSIPERIVYRLPVISPVYKGIKQVFETLMSGKSQAFREVVMFEYPRQGVWSLGFVTGKAPANFQVMPDAELTGVLIPSALNPTAGFLVFLPRRDLRILPISVEQALKMIISGGLVAPA